MWANSRDFSEKKDIILQFKEEMKRLQKELMEVKEAKKHLESKKVTETSGGSRIFLRG